MDTCSSSSQSLPLGYRHSCQQDGHMLLIFTVFTTGIQTQLPLQIHPVSVHAEFVTLDVLPVWHHGGLLTEVGDGPGKVVVHILLLISVAPAGSLNRRLLHGSLLDYLNISHVSCRSESSKYKLG